MRHGKAARSPVELTGDGGSGRRMLHRGATLEEDTLAVVRATLEAIAWRECEERRKVALLALNLSAFLEGL